MSWVTDETQDVLKCLNLLRKLLSFAANLCAVEEMPVIIGCSLRLALDDIKQVIFGQLFQYNSPKFRLTINDEILNRVI